jgi:hypothetical protein
MTYKEAAYCMRSYLPDGIDKCLDCPYYNSVDKGTYKTCKSSEAHKMAAEMFEKLARQNEIKRLLEEGADRCSR